MEHEKHWHKCAHRQIDVPQSVKHRLCVLRLPHAVRIAYR